MKSIAEFKVLIDEACPECPEPGCGEMYFEWPDADTNEKIVYIARDALFAAVCSKGHAIEMYLSELKAAVVEAHTRTERTLGRRVSQKACKHPQSVQGRLEDGQVSPGLDGLLEGPLDVLYCVMCGAKRAKPPSEPSGPSKTIWTPP